MLESILKRKDFIILINEIKNKNLKTDNNKDNLLYIIFDSLIKYKIIFINDDYLDEYIKSLDKLILRINNYNDIELGINKIILKLCIRKLELNNSNSINNKEKIIDYLYLKYIRDGYLYHAINSIYVSDILKDGLIPEKYKNNYNDFIKIKEIINKHTKEEIIKKSFKEDYITMTDNFKKAYYYATNSPMYFSDLLSTGPQKNIHKYINDSYYRKDYKDCINNINRLSNELNLSLKETNYIKEVVKKEWNNYKCNIAKPTIMLVKRNVINYNRENEEKELLKLKDMEIEEAVNTILNGKQDRIKVKDKISSNDIEFIELYSYNDLYDVEKDDNTDIINDYGYVTILLLIGSLLITIGVIMSIIMMEVS